VTSSTRVVALVSKREFDSRVRTKSFVIGLLVTVLLLAAITVGPLLLGDDADQRLGLVGDDPAPPVLTAAAEQAGLELTTVEVTDADAARRQVQAGELDAVLVDGERVVVESELDPALRGVLEGALAQAAVMEVLAERGVDPAVLATAAEGATLQVTALDPPEPGAAERTGIAFVMVIVMYFQLLTFGIAVAMGVVEEKTSRVVEVLLASIRPWQLLLGKVLGIGAAGLLQLVVLGAVGLGVGTATGVITLTGTAVSVFLGSLGWFLLGFLFFAVLYAAAGALAGGAQRRHHPDDVADPPAVLRRDLLGAVAGRGAGPDAGLDTPVLAPADASPAGLG